MRSIKDVWFIGDHMVRNAYPYLQSLQEDHGTGHVNYMHANYDTYVFYPVFTETNVLTMVRNSLVEALNRRLKFPTTIVILLSDQIIMEDPLYLPSEIDRKIKWLLREIDAIIKIRKSLLPAKAYIFGEPRIMWVRAFNNTKSNYISRDILLKYNNMLRKICMAKAVYTIPTYTYDESGSRCFDRDGKTQIKEGFDLLWYDIITGIKKHDHNDEQANIDQIIREHGKLRDHNDSANYSSKVSTNRSDHPETNHDQNNYHGEGDGYNNSSYHRKSDGRRTHRKSRREDKDDYHRSRRRSHHSRY